MVTMAQSVYVIVFWHSKKTPTTQQRQMSYSTYNEDGMTIRTEFSKIYGDDCIVYGNYNKIYGNRCKVYGDYNTFYGQDCCVEGNYNENKQGTNYVGSGGSFNKKFSHGRPQPKPQPVVQVIQVVQPVAQSVVQPVVQVVQQQPIKKDPKDYTLDDKLAELQAIASTKEIIENLQAMQKEKLDAYKRELDIAYEKTLHFLYDKYIVEDQQKKKQAAEDLVKAATTADAKRKAEDELKKNKEDTAKMEAMFKFFTEQSKKPQESMDTQ